MSCLIIDNYIFNIFNFIKSIVQKDSIKLKFSVDEKNNNNFNAMVKYV